MISDAAWKDDQKLLRIPHVSSASRWYALLLSPYLSEPLQHKFWNDLACGKVYFVLFLIYWVKSESQSSAPIQQQIIQVRVLKYFTSTYMLIFIISKIIIQNQDFLIWIYVAFFSLNFNLFFFSLQY